MTPKIKFGTDGWRGIIADDFTFANVRYCTQAVAEYLRDKQLAPRGMVVGYDTRFASERFAAAVAEVFAGNGIKTHLCPQATPTPIVSFGVTHQKAAGAVIITASHNPGEWNGFKIKSPDGSSAPTQVEAEVESRLPQIMAQDNIKRLDLEEGLSKGIIRYLDLTPAYFDHIGHLVDLDSLRRSGLKIVVDSMFGAGSGHFKRVLGGGSTEVVEINGERNPIFPGIQPEPIARHLKKLSATIRDSGASIGLATDGDADRIGIVDEKGQPLTPLQIFALLALYLFEVRGERGPIVRTLTTTCMLDKLGKIYGVPVYETKVGFKYVAPIMMAENALIGGEESSGFGFRGHIPERDGILAGLYLLDLMNKLRKSPSQLIDHLYSKVGPHHYNRVDLEFPPADREKIISRIAGRTPAEIGGAKVIKVNTADGFHFSLADGSWLLVRFSGTEPILRIYAEASSLERANSMIAEGKKLLGGVNNEYILESPETYRLLDPSGMLGHLVQFPEQCQRAWHNATDFNYPKDFLKVDRVVISGMGGSAIGGDFVRRLAMLENSLPVWVHRDYGLPPHVDRNTLLIFSSYSGNTEETLSCFSESLRTQAKKIVLTTGGKLKALAEKERIPVLAIDYEAPPRAAFSHSFLSLLGMFHSLRFLQDKSADMKESLGVMKKIQDGVSEKTPLDSNLAKQLAADLFGRLAVIYGAGLLSDVSFRWKTQINENSKAWAFHEVFPELNHNAVVGYPLPPETRERVMVVLLHSASLHPRISTRYQVTSEILTKAGIKHKRIEATGRSPLAQMIGLVLLGDYVSYYLAMLNRTDPMPVPVIDTLKSRLAQSE